MLRHHIGKLLLLGRKHDGADYSPPHHPLVKRPADVVQNTKSDISLISNASALHDIGKIAVPSEILNKPGRLTKEEFDIMKTHAAEGGKMLLRNSTILDKISTIS